MIHVYLTFRIDASVQLGLIGFRPSPDTSLLHSGRSTMHVPLNRQRSLFRAIENCHHRTHPLDDITSPRLCSTVATSASVSIPHLCGIYLNDHIPYRTFRSCHGNHYHSPRAHAQLLACSVRQGKHDQCGSTRPPPLSLPTRSLPPVSRRAPTSRATACTSEPDGRGTAHQMHARLSRPPHGSFRTSLRSGQQVCAVAR